MVPSERSQTEGAVASWDRQVRPDGSRMAATGVGWGGWGWGAGLPSATMETWECQRRSHRAAVIFLPPGCTRHVKSVVKPAPQSPACLGTPSGSRAGHTLPLRVWSPLLAPGLGTGARPCGRPRPPAPPPACTSPRACCWGGPSRPLPAGSGGRVRMTAVSVEGCAADRGRVLSRSSLAVGQWKDKYLFREQMASPGAARPGGDGSGCCAAGVGRAAPWPRPMQAARAVELPWG